MNLILISVYRIIYRVSKIKSISFISALIYISILNLLTIYGLCTLLSGVLPTAYLLRLFSFPYLIAIFVGMVGLLFLLTPARKYIDGEHNRKSGNTASIIYSLIAVLLFFYILFCNGKI